MNIKLSVIIPCYNHGKYLPEALASIDNSVYRAQIEILIINDGSTDKLTNTLIDNLDSERYVVIKQNNQGLARSRNNGIKLAKADYVLMLDADNFIEPVFILDFFDFLKKGEEFDALYGDAMHFGMQNFLRKQGCFDLLRIIKGNYIDACAIFKKNKLIEIGMYDAKMPVMGYEDWDLWIRLGLNNSVLKYVNKTYFKYRVSEDSMIRSHKSDYFSRTRDYLVLKNRCNNRFFERIIIDYLNYHIDSKMVFKLILKKLGIRKNIYFINKL